MAVPSPVGDVKIVSPISTFVLKPWHSNKVHTHTKSELIFQNPRSIGQLYLRRSLKSIENPQSRSFWYTGRKRFNLYLGKSSSKSVSKQLDFLTFGLRLAKGCVQTDSTTPNIVAPTMLGVVAWVLALVYKPMQQLPTMLRPAVHRGKDTTHKSL